MTSGFSTFPFTPTFPEYTGPYPVGTIDVEIATSELQDSSTSRFAPSPTIAFRCYYPCQKPKSRAKAVYWVQKPQKKVIGAYARFLGAGSGLSGFLSYFPQNLYYIQIPTHRDAPLEDSPESPSRWPLLIFSHGLGGSRNAYSYLCGSLASRGLVVLAPEHRDGSCPVSYVRATAGTEPETVDYKHFAHKSSPAVYEGRDEQLQIRMWELHLLHKALDQLHRGERLTNLDEKPLGNDGASTRTLAQFRGKLAIDEPGSIAWAGHSFGATSMAQFVKSIFYHPSHPHYHNHSLRIPSADASPLLRFEPSQDLLAQITPSSPTILLDIWTLPLNSPATATLKSKPMPCHTPVVDSADDGTHGLRGATPVLAILSSAFANWSSNFRDMKALLSAPSPKRSKGLLGAQPQSPAHIFYPLNSAHLNASDFGILFPRITKYFAKAQEPDRTVQLSVRAILQVLRESGIKVAGDKDLDILSKEAGKVRGWIVVDVNDTGEGPAAN